MFWNANPYARIRIGQQEFTTKSNPGGGKNPIWNKEFVFDIYSERRMEVVVLDLKDGGSDKFMGKCKVSITDWIADGTFEGDLVLDDNAGRISIACSFQRHSSRFTATNEDAVTQSHLWVAASGGKVAVVTALLEGGANVNQTNNCGNSPLHQAAINGHEAVVAILLDIGANVNQADISGWTPLLFAARNGHATVVTALLEGGANVNQADNRGISPLHTAAHNGHKAVVSVLLSKGANVNQADSSGQSPLHLAVINGHESVIAILLDIGANVNQADNKGDFVLDIASLQEDIFNLLLKHGARYKTQRGTLTISSIECHNLRPDWYRMGPFQVSLAVDGDTTSVQCTGYRGGGRKLLVWSDELKFPVRIEDKYMKLRVSASTQLVHPLDRRRHPSKDFATQHINIDELIETGRVHLKLLALARNYHRTTRSVGGVSITCTFARTTVNTGGGKQTNGDDTDGNTVLVIERALRTIPVMTTSKIDDLQSSDLSFMPPFRVVAAELLSNESTALDSVTYLYSNPFILVRHKMLLERWLRGNRRVTREERAMKELQWRRANELIEVAGQRSAHKFVFGLIKKGNLQRLQDLGASVLIISDPAVERRSYSLLPGVPQKFIVIRDMWGRTPLHIAVCVGNIAMVKWLVKKCKLNIDDDGSEGPVDFLQGKTPLRLACERGNENMIAALLELGANPLARSRDNDEEGDGLPALIGLTDVNQIDHRLHGNRKTYLHLAAGLSDT